MTPNRPTILHIIPVLSRGGAELQLCKLAEAQVQAGADVMVGCLRASEELRARLRSSGITLLASSDSKIRFGPRLIRASRSSHVIHAWMYHAFLVSAVLRPWGRAAHIWAVRRTSPDSVGLSRRTRLVVRITRLLSARFADGIIYCSDAAMEAHEQFGFRTRHARVVHNAVSVTPPNDARAWTGPPMTFGTMGRWHRDKGLDVLLEAWRLAAGSLGDVQLVLAGPGLDCHNDALRSELTRNQLSSSVELLGQLDDPASFLASLDCLVSPSRTEGFPNVVAEAMALGIPVIATRVGGTPEVLGECGLMIGPENPAELAAAIAGFVHDPQDLRQRASGGPERVANEFSDATTDRLTNEFYETVTR